MLLDTFWIVFGYSWDAFCLFLTRAGNRLEAAPSVASGDILGSIFLSFRKTSWN